jgi:hypothetical protein
VDPADANAFGRTFHLITKDDDGKLRRRDYFFDGTRVHLSGTQDYGQAVAGDKAKPQKLDATKVQGKSRGGWLRRQWNSLKSRFSGS